MKGTITKYRKRDGRVSWGYYYKAEGQQFTKSGFATRSDARDALDRALGISLSQRTEAPPRPEEPPADSDARHLSDYLDYWLNEHAALRCAPATMELYRKLAEYLKRLLGTVSVRDLKAAQIQETVNRLLLHGGIKTDEHPQGRPLSAKRTHAIASLLHTCLADAVRLEHLHVNPMADRRVKLPKRPKRKPAVLDPDMLGKLFATAEGVRAYAYIVLAACSGARRGELCALTWPISISRKACSRSPKVSNRPRLAACE